MPGTVERRELSVGAGARGSMGEKALSFRKSCQRHDYPESILTSTSFNHVRFNRDEGDKGDKAQQQDSTKEN